MPIGGEPELEASKRSFDSFFSSLSQAGGYFCRAARSLDALTCRSFDSARPRCRLKCIMAASSGERSRSQFPHVPRPVSNGNAERGRTFRGLLGRIAIGMVSEEREEFSKTIPQPCSTPEPFREAGVTLEQRQKYTAPSPLLRGKRRRMGFSDWW